MGVPTVFKFVKSEEDRKVVELVISQTVFHRSYIAPPETPPAQLEVLRAAFDKTMADPQFLADAEKMRIDIEPLSGAKVQEVVASSTPRRRRSSSARARRSGRTDERAANDRALPSRLVGLRRQGALCARREGPRLAGPLSSTSCKGDQFAPRLSASSIPRRWCRRWCTTAASSSSRPSSTNISTTCSPIRRSSPRRRQARAAMRLWTKAVDEDLHPACAEVTFSSCHRHIIRRLPQEDYEAFLDSTPSHSVTPRWHARKKEIVTHGFDAPGLAADLPAVRRLSRQDGEDAGRPALARGRYVLARRRRGDALRQPARHARHGRRCGRASRPRVTDWFDSHQGAADVQAGVPRLVPARPHRRSR